MSIVKHLEITFIDGTVEELDSKFGRATVVDDVLNTFDTNCAYGPNPRGPSFPLANVRRWEWKDGYR